MMHKVKLKLQQVVFWVKLHINLFKENSRREDVNELKASYVQSVLIIVIVILFIVWASEFELDVASQSNGVVIAASQTRPVQHLEGGIIRKIYVKEGDTVKAGQKLIELEHVIVDADVGALKAQIASLKIKTLRLQAQITLQTKIELPKEFVGKLSSEVNSANLIVSIYTEKIKSSVQSQRLKIEQKKAELSELVARKKHAKSKLGILRKQLQISEALLKKGLATEYERLNLLKEEQGLVGLIAESDAIDNRLNAAISQEKSALKSFLAGEREKLQIEFVEIKIRQKELEERLLKFSDTSQRLLVVSPIEGTVLHLNVLSEGAVVNPGGTVLSIVPIDDPLLIEAQLPVGDVGLIKIGQPARMDLVSGTARGYLAINGKVVYISADTVVDEAGMPFYKVRLKPDALYFERGHQRFPLIPGVRVMASILVGERSVLAYIIEPFRASSFGALTEP